MGFCILDGNYGSDLYTPGCSHTKNNPTPGEWWVVDLGDNYNVGEVFITNRNGWGKIN